MSRLSLRDAYNPREHVWVTDELGASTGPTARPR